MNREEKKQTVAEQHEMFQDGELVIVFHYRGSTVAQMSELRSDALQSEVKVKVTKNNLTKIALKDTKFEGLTDYFTGPTAMAVSKDPVAAAKIVADKAKANDNLEIVAGAMGEKVMDKEAVQALAKLPSLDELRGKLVGVISAPAQQIASVTQAPAGQLARVFGAYGQKQ